MRIPLGAKLKPVRQEVLILLALGLGGNPELLRILGEDRTVIPVFLKKIQVTQGSILGDPMLGDLKAKKKKKLGSAAWLREMLSKGCQVSMGKASYLQL